MKNSAVRIDIALVDRDLVRSRSHAQRLIADGAVLVNGEKSSKASQLVIPTDVLEVVASDHYVSRAAHKLRAGLDGFSLTVQGKRCLDLGTSTGGFAQVLIERGAEQVLGIEVGHGQLAPSLVAEPRLTLLEGFNARELSEEAIAERLGDHWRQYAPQLVVADLSFISLRYVLEPAVSFAGPDAHFLFLVKPQFEVGRTRVREGLVPDADDRIMAVLELLNYASSIGLFGAGILPSPIQGTHGNFEYLLCLERRETIFQAELEEQVRAIVANEGSLGIKGVKDK